MKRNQTSKFWRNKCDKLIQELGREVYDSCLICGGEYSCLHHFYPKSQTTFLRYNWDNLIPICQSCHFSHHNGNPEIHATVIHLKGEDWYNNLKNLKKNNLYVNAGYMYFRNKHEELAKINPKYLE